MRRFSMKNMFMLQCVAILMLVQQGLASKKYAYVVTPSVLRFNYAEDILVGWFGDGRDQSYRVWLENSKHKIFSIRRGYVVDEANPSKTTITVTEDDLFDEILAVKPRAVKLCAEVGNINLPCKQLSLDYKTGYLILQTDKPVYTPREKVSVRVAAVDETMKPMNNTMMSFEIISPSPSNMTFGRKTTHVKGYSGFYWHTFTIPPYPELGVWTARVQYLGQYETEGRATFQVMEYVLPTFEVSIFKDKEVILESTKELMVTVNAVYVYGKSVDGKANLLFNVTDEMGGSQNLQFGLKKSLIDGTTDFTVNMTELLHTVQPFPINSRLLIQASVIESVTGKAEGVFDNNVLLAKDFYKLSFARSRKTFHRQNNYHLKVDLLDANDLPVESSIEVTLYRLHKDSIVETQQKLNSKSGQSLGIFTAPDYPTMTFEASVMYENTKIMSDKFTVYAYQGKKMVYVDTVTRDNKLVLEVHSDLEKSTKILFLGVTRGTLVDHFVRESTTSGSLSEVISEKLKERLSPRARFVVLSVNRDDSSLVTDAMKIDLPAKCNGKGLSLSTEQPQYKPGDRMKLKITGEPYMHVGLGGMDKAILALDSENILKTDRLFQEQRAHDRGCGQGGGLTDGEVLKSAGLSVLTNAKINEPSPTTPKDPECESSKRRKRDTMNCNGANPKCCESGMEFAESVIYEMSDDEIAMIIPESKCYEKARYMIKYLPKLPIKCIVAYFRACREQIQWFISDVTQLTARSLDDQSMYEADLKPFGKSGLRARTYFKESIMFDEKADKVQLSQNGDYELTVSLPDSITTWYLQAIGIASSGTMCIAEPKNIFVMKDFFIQLDLPYKAKRFEYFEVKATIFNYANTADEMMVHMYMEATKGICYGNEPFKPSVPMTIEIGSNSAKSVSFLTMPLKEGEFSITMTAVVSHGSTIMADKIRKTVLVENEGIEVRETFQVCINQSKECVESKNRVTTSREGNVQTSRIDLTLSSEAISGTAKATGYIEGHVMASVVGSFLHGMESLFRKPAGCAEQTISSTVPNVFALLYIKSTKQMTQNAEVTGIDNIRHGIDREKSEYRDKATSSYANNVWLTAYVLKVFCHAKRVVDDVLNEREDIYSTTMWLLTHQSSNGMFQGPGYVYLTNLKSPEKPDNWGLTTYVLITLLECDRYQDEISSSVKDAADYLGQIELKWFETNPHGLAMITYALALATLDSPRSKQLKDLLLQTKIKSDDSGTIHWESSGTGATSGNIETTAYALLAMLQFDDLETSAGIVSWLSMQQETSGNLGSTQSTAIALQGLSKYAIRTSTPVTDIELTLIAAKWDQKQLRLSNNNSNLQTIVHNLPVDKGSELTLSATIKGGTGRMKIELLYYRQAQPHEVCAFNVSTVQTSEVAIEGIDYSVLKQSARQCDVCGNCAREPSPGNEDYSGLSTTSSPMIVQSKMGRIKRSTTSKKKCIRFSVSSINRNSHGMSIVKFGLQTGVTVVKEDLDELMERNKNIFLYETPDSQEGYIVFYLYTLDSTTNNFVFRVDDTYNKTVPTLRQPAIVEVYDYYNDDANCKTLYDIDGSVETSFYHKCNDNECTCLRSICAKDVYDKIIRLISKKRAIAELLKYSCDGLKADYATVVKIKKVFPNNGSRERMAEGEIVNHYKNGTNQLFKGDTMKFYWSSICTFPDLKENGKYLVIGTDGHKVNLADNSKEMRYPLSESTLIIEKRQDGATNSIRVNNMLNRFGENLREKGCQA